MFLGRCTAITKHGRQCLLRAEQGQTLCRYHCGGAVTAAVHERNRQGTARYWAKRRAAAVAATRIRPSSIYKAAVAST